MGQMGRMPANTGKRFIPPHGGYAGLDQPIRKLEKDFLAEGGLRERMTRARLAQRAKQKRELNP
jgi:hypothetical protein